MIRTSAPLNQSYRMFSEHDTGQRVQIACVARRKSFPVLAHLLVTRFLDIFQVKQYLAGSHVVFIGIWRPMEGKTGFFWRLSVFAVKNSRFSPARPCARKFSSQLFVKCNKKKFVKFSQEIAWCCRRNLSSGNVCDLNMAFWVQLAEF